MLARMPHSRYAAGAAILVGSLTMGCAGGNGTASPQTPPGVGGGTATGPRLHWDQLAPDAAELPRYAFVLYVNGTPVALAGSACGALAGDTLTGPVRRRCRGSPSARTRSRWPPG
jgi:hypothetical protein